MHSNHHEIPNDLRNQLDSILQDLESVKTGNTSPISTLKSVVVNGNEALKADFQLHHETRQTVYGRVYLVDKILCCAAQHCFTTKMQDLSIVAVGGYGRGELHPHSDIDILVLLANDHDEQCNEEIEKFLMLLWDIKLEIGHSVRSLQECVEESENDITVITNMMESRLLCGQEKLYAEMIDATDADKIWNSKLFFEAKLEEQNNRYIKFEKTAYKLEPNVKESPGGLRDIQMIGWVAKRHFGANRLSELINHGFLTPQEYQALKDGEELLWKIRTGLHYLTNRREDRLLFDFQRDLAIEFGFEDGPNNLAIEQFMQRYYRTVMELERLNEMLLQLLKEVILLTNESAEPVIINARFESIHGYISARSADIFTNEPTTLLEIFLLLEEDHELRGVRAQTIRLIRQNIDLINDGFRQSDKAKALFIAILSQPEGVLHQLRRMNRYGILAAYIPAFSKIVGRMQYDLFHAYTVDEHTLTVVRNLRRFSATEFLHEYPLCSAVFNHLPKPELIYLAGLFHDIAKGRGGDHSVLGAEDALTFCLDHHLEQDDAELVSWLVKNHLVMSTTAQRKDISDPDVVNTFATLVSSQINLDYLYLLTVADIRGTNPSAWNSWKDSLLAELYNKTSVVLRLGKQTSASVDKSIRQSQRSTLLLIATDGITPEQADQVWKSFSNEYFLKFTPDEIANHVRLINNADDMSSPILQISRQGDRGTIEIVVYARQHPNLFARTAATLEQMGLNIVDAFVMTTDTEETMNVFQCLEEQIDFAGMAHRIDEIEHALQLAYSSDEQSPDLIQHHVPRTLKHFTFPAEITLEQDKTRNRTVIRIIATDRPGLLARITRAFIICNIQIHHARVATLGERAEDLFHITDSQNKPIIDIEKQSEIIETIKQGLNEKQANQLTF